MRAMVRRADAVVVGHCGFHGPPADVGRAEIGYTVFARHRRRGYGLEAARALVGFARAQGTEIVFAAVAADNLASLAIVRALGFQQTGVQIDETDGEELVFELRSAEPSVKGDAEPLKTAYSHSDDVTIANPFGPPMRGWKPAAETMECAASLYREGESGDAVFSAYGFTDAGPTDTALGGPVSSTDQTIVNIDRVVDSAPPLDVVVGPLQQNVTPEAPLVLLLPLAGAGVAAAAPRRRRGRLTARDE